MSKATRRFIINKLGELVISLLIVTILSFLLVRLSPIDPAEAYARRSMAAFSFTDEQMEALREKMGLNDSLPVQYVKWVRDAFHLDFGKSFVSGQSVYVTVHTPLSREVFWHIHAKIPRYLFFSMGKKAIQFQVFLFCFLESPYRIIYCNMNFRCFPFLGFI